MEKRSMLLLLFSLFLACGHQGHGTHLVGGEITYRCLGNNNYEVTLIIYRDCLTHSLLDPSAAITVFNQNGSIAANQRAPLIRASNLPLDAPNNCTTLPNNLCTEKGVYKTTFNLPPTAGGYTISHQRCCRNNTITNINNINSDWGSTYSTSIPPMDSCNSSPKFSADPPIVLCLDQEVSLDLSATDLDGDSLRYELCSVLHGGANLPAHLRAPDPANPPPYSAVPFEPGYSSSYPIVSSPAFSIDPSTGELHGKPTQVGQFVFAICVSEYRNGIKTSTTRRDFQFNVSSACKTIISQIEPQSANSSNICSGETIHFTNLSAHASSFLWDFGDTTVLHDTSVSKNPTYIYPDTGTYYVTLIAEPYKDCADTSVSVFEVYKEPKVEFTVKGNFCFENNSLDFHTSGEFTENATFEWDFGGPVVSGNHSAQSPQGVRYREPGKYYVNVEVTDFTCTSTYGDTVMVTEYPTIGEEVPVGDGCVPHTVQFVDRSKAEGTVLHYWFFGDGHVSYEPNPEHTYLVPGNYTVEHAIKTLDGCRDSGYSRYENAIRVFPTPNSDLDVHPREQSIYTPEFTITNSSTEYDFTETFMPDGSMVENLTTQRFSIEDTGTYPITHVAYNVHGCTDTIVDSVQVTTPFNLYVPNSFTPDGDGTNDYFYFAATDVRSITLEICNRWGQVVFSSNDLQAKWNGKLHNTGEELPAGIYTYVLIADVKNGGYDFKKRGIIRLIR